MKSVDDMNIRELCNYLIGKYPDGGYVSRCTVFGHALDDGTITQEKYNEARTYYGSIWNYTGD